MNEHTMKAVVVRETGKKGDWNTLSIDTVPMPALKHGEVLVRVEACSVNRADLLQRRGFYPPPPGASSILGLDFAGTVAETPTGTGDWKAGDRVFGIAAGGGYGRYVAVPADHLVRIPERLDFIEAAGAAEVFFTAYLNLFIEAGLRQGETLLVHGGGSGVGTAAIQLAKEAGATVVTTAGDPLKVGRCLEIGAHFAVNYKEDDFAARTAEFTGGRGVDVILDWIGAPYLAKHLELLKTGGRLVFIGLMGGNKAEINLASVLGKRLRLIGSILRARPDEEKASITRAFRKDVLPLLESGAVHPVIDRALPVASAEEAHLAMREGKHFGKIVLTWS
ncbi:MAG: NAD(P)H-quinone oxidoreductase [Syntrophobacteraceae bacterium]